MMTNIDYVLIGKWLASGFYIQDTSSKKTFEKWAIVHFQRALSGKGIVQ